MNLRRRAGAPRLIEWTGERCVPWTPDVQVAYEHLHRYLWAAGVLNDRKVLDVGSGEGFGASILAGSAVEVTGIDVDERTIEHARLNWSDAKVSFSLGSALDMSMFQDGQFDAVVAFEVIEHVKDQERLLAEVGRVLSADGILIISTPDRRIYSESSGQSNPFHERELSYEEFTAMLEKSFEHVAVWGQRTITGSHLGALDSSPVQVGNASAEFFVERAGDEWRLAGDPAALYMVAVASRGALPEIASSSTLGDCELSLLRSKEREMGDVVRAVSSQRDEAMQHERQALGVAGEEALERRRLAGDLRVRDEYVRHRQAEIAATRGRLEDSQRQLTDVAAQLELARLEHRRVEESVTWQAFQRVRAKVFGAIGENSLSARTLRAGIRLGGRLLSRGSSPELVVETVPEPLGEPIHLPSFAKPEASLIIPVYSGAELTRRCLETVRDNTDRVAYEVILVDDCADAETKRLLEVVHGARVIVNERNYGYLQSVNRGASVAHGDWIVLCNNDIEVTPDWLTELLVCGGADERVAVVAPKFISPNGLLSEAGGILWSDATGNNYGRGEDPNAFRYDFTREVDYGSAAALAVRADVWREVGGFDERYVPMYYEDADFCMEARKRGWRVIYEPSAVVVHLEGGTAGTDPSIGHKRHQETNRLKFLEKWRAVLEREHLPPGRGQERVAASRLRPPRVLVVDFRVPMLDRDAGSLRMFEIVRSLLGLGFAVTFLPDNFTPIQPYTRDLQRLGVEVIYGAVDMLSEFAAMAPGLVAAILSRPHSASRWLDSVREFAPAATVAYDTVDLHWVRESRRFALTARVGQSNGTLTTHGPKAAALRELELALVRASDLTIAVTEDEKTHLLDAVPEAKIVIIPTIHEVLNIVPPPSERAGVLFVGGFEHPPNIGAATFLVREVMPLVWARVGEVPVTIAGGSPPSEVEGLAGEQVKVTGWVAELEPLLGSSRVLVAPVLFGAGVKGKITQGLAAGLPVVTTSLGAEGLDGEDGVSMLVADDAEGLAERIVRVIEDDALWTKLSHEGQSLIAGKCSREVLSARLAEMLAVGQAATTAHAG